MSISSVSRFCDQRTLLLAFWGGFLSLLSGGALVAQNQGNAPTEPAPGSPKAAVAPAFWGYEGARNEFTEVVWELQMGDFSEASYENAVEALLSDFENRTHRRLQPGVHGQVGLKLYNNSGPGFGTPPALVRALISALTARGFARRAILLIDASEGGLRANGYLPPLSEMHRGYTFEGTRVVPLDRGWHFHETWYYDNPLPRQTSTSIFSEEIRAALRRDPEPEDRKSFLAAPLIMECDFWINLPAATDHPALGLNGALANASLWSVSNRERFFYSKANAPIAIAEILGIPEWLNNLAFTLYSLETYQYIGGPMFNSLYTRSEPLLWLSVNPVVLDASLLERINRARTSTGFDPLPEQLQLEYAQRIGIGPKDVQKVQWIRR